MVIAVIIVENTWSKAAGAPVLVNNTGKHTIHEQTAEFVQTPRGREKHPIRLLAHVLRPCSGWCCDWEQDFRSVKVCWTQRSWGWRRHRRRMLLICWVSWSVTLRILQLLSLCQSLLWTGVEQMTQILCFRKNKPQRRQTTTWWEEKSYVRLNLCCCSLKTLKQNRTLVDVIDRTCVYLQGHIHSIEKGLWSKCCGCGGHLAAGGVEMVRRITASCCLLANYTGST